MNHPQLLDRARSGQPSAIAALMNQQLQGHQTHAKITHKGRVLHVFLESDGDLDREKMVAFVRRGVENLQLAAIASVTVYGKRRDREMPDWTTEFEFPQPSPQPIAKPLLSSHRSRIKSPATPQGDVVQVALQDTWEALKFFIKDPVEKLPAFAIAIGKPRLLGVGVAFASLYVASSILSIYSTAHSRAFSFLLPLEPKFLSILSAYGVQFGVVVLLVTIARQLFNGKGSVEGDVFVAGTLLLPLGTGIFTSTLLGLTSASLTLAVAVFSTIYAILGLYGGCRQILKIPPSRAPLAVASLGSAAVIVSMLWLSRILPNAVL